MILKLPNYGTIEFEEENKFWSICLGQEWCDECDSITKLSLDLIKDSEEYAESINLGKSWAKLLDDESPTIQCIKPPSLVGMHISLGRWSKTDEDIPKCLIEGKQVSFKIMGDIKTMKTFREIPTNLPGQYTKNGMRYYPTLWILAEIQFNDFQFETKYPPHISLACVAVQLNVDKVEKLNEDKVAKHSDNNIPGNDIEEKEDKK